MNRNSLQVIIRLALLLALVVIALGAYTRLVGAGLGCPDWPGCYGHLIMPSSAEDISAANARYPENRFTSSLAIPEVVHRAFAGGLALFILAIALIFSWCNVRKMELRPFISVKLAWFTVAMVITQALFGMWTVTLKLWPQVVTAHLIGGFTTLSLLFLMELRSRGQMYSDSVITLTSWESQSGLKVLAWLVFAVIVVQIVLGGWTSSNYAALACLDFPTCQQSWWPEMDFAAGFNFQQSIGPNYLGGQLDNAARVAIHYSHRVNALLVVALSLLLIWRCHTRGIAGLSRAANKFFLLLLLQVALGISNVVFYLPLYVAVAHNLVGALLVLGTINLLSHIHKLRPHKISDLV